MDMSKFAGSMFLKVEDIKLTGPVRLIITDISEGRYGKPDITFNDGSRLSCNATNSRVLVKAYGKESDDWIGKLVKLELGEIDYQGQARESIIVKPLSPPVESEAPPKPDLNDEIPF